MTKEFKPGEFEFRITFFGNERATIKFMTEPKSEIIEIKYAVIKEPERILDFKQFKEIFFKYMYKKGQKAGFFIVNEVTDQRESVWIPIKWDDAPNYDDTVRHIRLFGDLTDIIKKIGG